MCSHTNCISSLFELLKQPTGESDWLIKATHSTLTMVIIIVISLHDSAFIRACHRHRLH